MSPTEPRRRVSIANRTIEVPVHEDAQTTERLATEITERFRDIEAASTRIDTQAFALQTAYAYAVELEQAKQEAAQDTRALVRDLIAIHERLREILAILDQDIG